MNSPELPFNRKTIALLAHAQREAGRLLHGGVEPAHVLLGMIRQGDCFAADLIRQSVPDLDALKAQVEEYLGLGSLDNVGLDVPLVPETEALLRQADGIRQQLNHTEIRSDHLLLAMTHDSSDPLACLLQTFNVSTKQVLEGILAEFGVVQKASPLEILLLQGLARKGGLTSQVIQSLLSRGENEGVREALLAGGHIREEEIVAIVAREYGCQSLDLGEFAPDEQLLHQFPGELARRLGVFPVRYDSDEDTLHVALADPFETTKLEEIQALWGVNVIPILTDERTLQGLIDRYFPPG